MEKMMTTEKAPNKKYFGPDEFYRGSSLFPCCLASLVK